MIKKLSIQNFQSHKKSVLEFDPGLNVIIGTSDSGKTAVVRALRWLISNRPSGDAFRSVWGGKTAVSVLLEGNDKIARVKDKAANQYFLDDMEFNAFGTAVPEEIVKALNMKEVNSQSQFDKPFLLTSTSGEVASHFNKIANIDQIDISQKIVEKWVREIANKIKTEKESITKLKHDLTAFDDLDKAEIELEILEESENDLIRWLQDETKLENLIQSLQDIESDIKQIEELLEPEKEIDNILDLYKVLESTRENEQALKKNIKTLQIVEEDLDDINTLVELESEVSAILELKTSLEKLNKDKKEFATLLLEIEVQAYTLVTWKEKENKLQKEFDKYMPDVCPLCDHPIIKK